MNDSKENSSSGEDSLSIENSISALKGENILIETASISTKEKSNDVEIKNERKKHSVTTEQNFTNEDVVLYFFCAALLVFIGFYFWNTQRTLEKTLLESQACESISQKTVNNGVPDHYIAYLSIQSSSSCYRYQQGARTLLTTSTRKNTGFLIGVLLAFMGCIIVVRRVRKMPITANMETPTNVKFRVITSSPGLFISILGTLIIISTIIRYDSFEVTDATIAPPIQYSSENQTSSAARERAKKLLQGNNNTATNSENNNNTATNSEKNNNE